MFELCKGRFAVLATAVTPAPNTGSSPGKAQSPMVMAFLICALVAFAVALVAGILAFVLADSPTGTPNQRRDLGRKRIARTVKTSGGSFGVAFVVCLTAAKSLGLVL